MNNSVRSILSVFMVEGGHSGNKARNKAMTLHFIVTLKTIQQLVQVTPTGMRNMLVQFVLISPASTRSSRDRMTRKILRNIDPGDTNRPRGEMEMSTLSLLELDPRR